MKSFDRIMFALSTIGTILTVAASVIHLLVFGGDPMLVFLAPMFFGLVTFAVWFTAVGIASVFKDAKMVASKPRAQPGSLLLG